VIIIVMGVASAGKTTVGQGLADQLGWPFRDADSFHPPANVAKMSAGVPLTDEDRWPWLDAIVAWMNERAAAGEHGVATCSALKRAYRDRLRASRAEVRFVHLHGDREVLAARIAARKDHFMPPSLLDSQLATLETPGADEAVVAVDVRMRPKEIVAAVAERLQ
jgi:carbohydrate kinase (thermoresistant glucokinase family)